MDRERVGEYVTISTVGEPCRAFVPDPLPPRPPLAISPALRGLADEALLGLGRLDSISALLPDTSLFLYMYIRKEAVLSSQIEGTQSSLADLLLFEMDAVPGVPLDDVREVANYVAALQHGLRRLRESFPLSLRLLREIHGILLAGSCGAEMEPGEFRRSQNWIGGTRPGTARYVPPPPERLMECLGPLERFLHDEPERLPVLYKAALAHVQFETIHPFLDGNGRLGRLLIVLLLVNEGVLRQPLLYLSLYFKTHRQEYYDLLQNVRTSGDWEGWLGFFMTAVKETTAKAVETAKRLGRLADEDRERIRLMGRAAGSALRVHHVLLQRPLLSGPAICELTGLWPGTVNSVLKRLQEMRLLREMTGKRRNRIYGYAQYIDILSQGTEPLEV